MLGQAESAIDDQELIARVKSGCPDAFDSIVARYRPRLIAICTRMLAGDRHLAEDITQECLVKAYRRIREDHRPLYLRAWLDTTARNACIDEYRRRRPQPVEQVPETPVDHPEPLGLDPELLQAWRRLDLRHRQVLALREVDGFSYQEIADVLGTSMGAVQSLLFRSRTALRREYARAGGGALALPLGLMLRRMDRVVEATVYALPRWGEQAAAVAIAAVLGAAAIFGIGGTPADVPAPAPGVEEVAAAASSWPSSQQPSEPDNLDPASAAQAPGDLEEPAAPGPTGLTDAVPRMTGAYEKKISMREALPPLYEPFSEATTVVGRPLQEATETAIDILP